MAGSLRQRTARWFGIATVALLFLLALSLGGWSSPTPDRPNIVVIVTDDQSLSSMDVLEAMPFLHGQLADPDSGWISFRNAFASTPLCCPARATILSGRYAHHTGVLRNLDGARFDDTSTIATWLDDRGYRTGLFGKYLNQYPFGGAAFVPPGWDVWAAKIHGDASTVYYDYSLSTNGDVTAYDHTAGDYMTDVLTERATAFIEDTPVWEPFFLYYSPTAPHSPWEPASRHVGRFADLTLTVPDAAVPGAQRGEPGWVDALPDMSAARLARTQEDRIAELETLLAVDEGIERIMSTLEREGELDDTVVVFLSDNGYAYGEHGVIAKRCPYDACTAVPYAIRVPGMLSGTRVEPVSNADLAPTLAAIAGASPATAVDGRSLLPVLRGRSLHRDGILLEWAGDAAIPPYWGYRTEEYLYVEYPLTGEVELFDLGEDPGQLVNVADDPFYGRVRRDLADDLAGLVPDVPPVGTMTELPSPSPSP